MKLTHKHTVFCPDHAGHLATGALLRSSRILSLCYSADGSRLAVATTGASGSNGGGGGRNCAVTLYDVRGGGYAKADKFSTKGNKKASAEQGGGGYVVRAMCFCPDAAGPPKLAIAQSDNIVFVYKWGSSKGGDKPNSSANKGEPADIWSGKKSICNKFPESSPIQALVWPSNRPQEMTYGLAEGSVRVGNLRTNKSKLLFRADSAVTSLASHPRGDGVVSGHADGSVYQYVFSGGAKMGGAGGAKRIVRHSCPPYALSWGKSVCAAGYDQCVVFYDPESGAEERAFSYSNAVENDELNDDEKGTGEFGRPLCREFAAAAFNPTGDSVVVGNYDSFYSYSYRSADGTWEEDPPMTVTHMGTVAALAWEPNGSSVALGTALGLVDTYDACFRRYTHRNALEIVYVSPSQILIRRKDEEEGGAADRPVVIRSAGEREIVKLSIHSEPGTDRDRFAVARTEEKLLLCDIDAPGGKISAIHWDSSVRGGGAGRERFIFDSPQACIISHAGELSVVEYGHDEVLCSIRTEYTSAHLLSVRINERPHHKPAENTTSSEEDGSNKKICYLLDRQTICLKDMISTAMTTVGHDVPIDFVELNSRGNLVLFRDKRRILHLYDADSQCRSTLLSKCGYAQWVPGSDVVVAQSGNRMCVWYNTKNPDQVTTRTISGEIEGIERSYGKTEVLVDDFGSMMSYTLAEELIEFGTAVEDNALVRAMDILETIETSPQSEAMWQQLHDVSLERWNFRLAERCAAALGNVARAAYLRQILQLCKEATESGIDYREDWRVQAKVFQLKRQFSKAEEVYLGQNKVEEAIRMYENISMYADAIRVAERRKHHRADEMKAQYLQWLLDTRQEEKAAALKEVEGDFLKAIKLYMNAGCPLAAARILSEQGIVSPSSLVESVAHALEDADLHDKAGSVYANMGAREKALESFVRGGAFRQAVELARGHFPSQVVGLEELWGDHLVSTNQIDAAIDHYLEAHALEKAVGAAIKARRWNKAASIAEDLEDSSTARGYFQQIGERWASLKRYDGAEQFFAKAGNFNATVSMYMEAGLADRALAAARSCLSGTKLVEFFVAQGRTLEQNGKIQEAEKMYLEADRLPLAIDMYKTHRDFDRLFQLVAEHNEDLLDETCTFIAQELEKEGKLKEAEDFYARCKNWLAAVNMYRAQDMWKDAIRVAQYLGGRDAIKRVAYAYALHLGEGPEAAKALSKVRVLDHAIEYATDSGNFDHAFLLSEDSNDATKINEIHLKYAIHLEEQGHIAEAEEEYIRADKPKDCIAMYMQRASFDDAMRVANVHDPSSIQEILLAQAQGCIDRKDFHQAEELYLEAGNPSLAVDAYRSEGMFDDALRIANLYMPHMSREIELAWKSADARSGSGGSKSDYLARGRQLERDGQHEEAIDAYLLPRTDALDDVADLEEIWTNAVRVARRHCDDAKCANTVKAVVSKLCQIHRHGRAAEILAEADELETAIGVALAGQCWDKARDLAHGRRDLMEQVESAIRDHMVHEGDAEDLARHGHSTAALDVLAQKGDWEKLWETAEESGMSLDVTSIYAAQRAEELLQSGKVADVTEAVVVLSERGAPDFNTSMNLYRDIVRRVLGWNKAQEKSARDHSGLVQTLKKILFSVATEHQSRDATTASEFADLLMAVHHTNVMRTCEKNNLPEIAVKCAITLLRYSKSIIPADKSFYKAGTMCREQGQKNLAFVLLNRFVDLVEAIEDGDPSAAEDADDFVEDGCVVPTDIELPKEQYLPNEDEREDVRDWVLSMALESGLERGLPGADRAKGTVYAGLYESSNNDPSCIVTGYPIPAQDLLKTENCQANRSDWNLLVSQTRECPWTGKPSNPAW